MCIDVLSSVSWCLLRFPFKKDFSICLYLQLFVGGLMSYCVFCVCLCIMVSNTYRVVFLFCFSSSCLPYVASFSELSIFDCVLGIPLRFIQIWTNKYNPFFWYILRHSWKIKKIVFFVFLINHYQKFKNLHKPTHKFTVTSKLQLFYVYFYLLCIPLFIFFAYMYINKTQYICLCNTKFKVSLNKSPFLL
jgi:hypothetical protein